MRAEGVLYLGEIRVETGVKSAPPVRRGVFSVDKERELFGGAGRLTIDVMKVNLRVAAFGNRARSDAEVSVNARVILPEQEYRTRNRREIVDDIYGFFREKAK